MIVSKKQMLAFVACFICLVLAINHFKVSVPHHATNILPKSRSVVEQNSSGQSDNVPARQSNTATCPPPCEHTVGSQQVEKLGSQQVEKLGSQQVEKLGSQQVEKLGSQQVEKFTELCMRATHMDLIDANFNGSLLSQAKFNAQYLYEEFRNVIPHDSLGNFRSHCWRESFSIQWDNSHYSGQIGNVSFRKEFKTFQEWQLKRIGIMASALPKKFPTREYQSDTVCLPNVFMAGLAKCGSTFYYCFINKLLSMAGVSAMGSSALKEPRFWALVDPFHYSYIPKLDDVGYYLLNFLPGMNMMTQGKDSVDLVDGSPNIVFTYPHFRKTEHELTNYCILPSVLPTLLPNSKYTIILRNPVGMLYSEFWFSCTTNGIKLSREQILKGPDLFHEGIVSRLEIFNMCMKDQLTFSVCKLDNKHTYASCIQQRLNLLDMCTHEILFDLFSFPQHCGLTRLHKGLYYVHIRKWLSVVSRDRLHVTTLEELTQDRHKVAHDLLTFLNIKTEVASSDIDSITCDEKSNSQRTVDYKHNPELQMRKDTQTLLENFYYPFNSMLADTLGIELLSLWY